MSQPLTIPTTEPSSVIDQKAMKVGMDGTVMDLTATSLALGQRKSNAAPYRTYQHIRQQSCQILSYIHCRNHHRFYDPKETVMSNDSARLTISQQESLRALDFEVTCEAKPECTTKAHWNVKLFCCQKELYVCQPCYEHDMGWAQYLEVKNKWIRCHHCHAEMTIKTWLTNNTWTKL